MPDDRVAGTGRPSAPDAALSASPFSVPTGTRSSSTVAAGNCSPQERGASGVARAHLSGSARS